MIQRLNYCWRWAATLLAIALFGLGGLVLSALLLPVAPWRDPVRRVAHARQLIQQAFASFLQIAQALGLMRLRVEGADRLRDCPNALVLANHPCLLDVVALLSLMPSANCVVKQALWHHPVMGLVVRGAGYVSNTGSTDVVMACQQALTDSSLILFPEGTRTQPGHALRFQRGAAYLALEGRRTVLPVLIRCTPAALTKQDRWFRIPPRRFELHIRVLEPITPRDWITDDLAPPLAARRLTGQLETFFTQELTRHGFNQA